MFFKVLGPLEIHTTQRVICFTAKRDMTVLALLLLEANKLVTVERLTAAVWDAHPPSTAHQQIQTCVWRLRNTLAKAGLDKDLITTRHRGYLLNVEPGTLDTQIFDRETAQARAAVADQNISGAIAHLRNALALWRGPALAGVQSPVVRSLAARWDERRLNVLEEQFELELRLDRHREVVGDLRTLVDNAPLWERPRGLLMIALHRSGRTSEALEVYRTGRQTLVEQMGIEPGRALQDIHRSILAGGRGPSSDTVARPEETAGAPARLPMDVADLTGRENQARRLCEALTTRDAVVFGLSGGRGVGKTALAVHVAHRVREAFPDGQLFADLGGQSSKPSDPADVLRSLLNALGVPSGQLPASLGARTALYRRLTARRRMLIVLDDARDLAQVEPLVPASPTTALVTARTRLSGLPGAVLVDVPGLEPATGRR